MNERTNDFNEGDVERAFDICDTRGNYHVGSLRA